jgi:hypothetical protein
MNKLLQVFSIIIISILLLTFVRISTNEVILVKSPIDNKEYLVNNYVDRQQAADTLATIRKNIGIMRDYLVKNKKLYPEYSTYIDLLNKRYDNVIIKENTEKNNYTSYSVNKGEEIVFCIRSKQNNQIHDINLLMYVALHEFAHVACPEIGHTPLFQKIFKFFLETGVLLQIYKYTDYANDSKEYCGIYISESIL